ncbi:hypothetical protein SNE40_007073 [Patella caerulea]|uniref:Uncharacterized protein n=1 Tax=Patella caerulea TaxID=87958 RepID=A0AAN8K2V3_PATCE
MGDENETVDAKSEFGKMAVNDTTSTVIMFLIFTLLIGSVLGFFTWKLVASLRNKQKLKDEKKKLKQQKKDKELQKKIKKK